MMRSVIYLFFLRKIDIEVAIGIQECERRIIYTPSAFIRTKCSAVLTNGYLAPRRML